MKKVLILATILLTFGAVNAQNFKLDGITLRASKGTVLGKVDGQSIRNASGSIIGKVDGQNIRNSAGSIVCKLDGTNIRNASGSIVAKVSDIPKAIGGAKQDATSVALWWFFCR
jgi:hypothetical protein